MDLLKKLNWYFLLISLTEMEISENSNTVAPCGGLFGRKTGKGKQRELTHLPQKLSKLKKVVLKVLPYCSSFPHF